MVNIQLQKTILDVVENQIRENNPPATKKTFDRLLSFMSTPAVPSPTPLLSPYIQILTPLS